MKKQLFKKALLFMGVVMFALISCKKEDPTPDPIASFQYEISTTNYLTVTFTNNSKDAVSFSWNFGDGNTSTEKAPTHTYAAEGTYTVVLTATNKDGVNHAFQADITITDPDKALKMLTGEVSKTWKLYRIGTSMGVGPVSNPRSWWSLGNDGSRPCIYYHEFTFTLAGAYIFDDKGSFWSEGITDPPVCMEAIPANMVNLDGVDVKEWLGGTHSFEYTPSTGMVTLTGLGAWIGLPKAATAGEVTVPQTSVSFKISIEELDGYDLMIVTFEYPPNPPATENWTWEFSYASYSNPALEPDVVTEPAWVPTDLPNITPDVLYHTFESVSSFVLLGEIGGASIITPGVDDPTDASATKVGKYERIANDYQEAQLFVSPDRKDINFTEFTKVSIDVYLPSSNNYDPLTKKVIIGFGDESEDGANWWQNLIQYVSDDVALDQWVTVSFDLTQALYDREDLDMVFIQIGGGGHSTTATFYVRNLIFE